MPQYQGLGPVPPGPEVAIWQRALLEGMKENLEIVMGQRGPGRAVTNDTIGVEPADFQVMKQVSARAEFTTSAATGVPTIADYVKLLNDVQQLASDVAKIQAAFNTLLINLRS